MKIILVLFGIIALFGACAAVPIKFSNPVDIYNLDDVPAGVVITDVTSGTIIGDGERHIIVGYSDLLYGAQMLDGPQDKPGQCVCSGNGGETVVYGDLSEPMVTLDGRSHCEPDNNNCVGLGKSVTGRLCMDMKLDNETCVVGIIRTTNGETYYLREVTHPDICFCNLYVTGSVENSMSNIQHITVDATKSSSRISLNFIVHDAQDNENRPGPVSCDIHPTYAGKTTKTRDGRFTMVNIHMYYQTYDRVSVSCVALTKSNDFADIGSLSVRIATEVKCECNNRSISDLITNPYYADICAAGQCMCQPGWAGDHCEKCVYTEFGFGCENNTFLIWMLISLMSIIIVLLAIIVALIVMLRTGKYILNKFKRE